MKTIFYLVILLTIGLAFAGCESSTETKIVTAPPATTPGNTATASTFPKEEAEKLIQRLATQDGCKDSTAEMRLSFTDGEGKPQQMDFRLQRKYEAGKISSLMTVLSPKEETEKALLAFEEEGKPTDAISYLSGLKKTAHLKSDNPLNFRGSKSTVQEMLGLELGKYEIASNKTIDDQDYYYFVQLSGKKGMDLAFPRIEISFKNSSNQPGLFVLFDEKDQPVKSMKILSVENPDRNSEYQTIKSIEITDSKNNQKLKLETRSIKYDTNLPASIFTEANLIKNVTAATAKLVQ
jgi:Outer membrane lipoprotein-sorting protein